VVTREMAGEVTRGQASEPIAQAGAPDAQEAGARVVALDESTRAWVRLGALSFHVSSVVPAERQPARPIVDWAAQSYTASCALVVGLALALLFAIPPDPKSLAIDSLLAQKRFPVFVLKPPAEEPLLQLDGDAHGGDQAGKRARGPGGQAGSPKATHVRKQYRIQGPTNEVRLAAQDVAAARAERVGIIGILRRTNATSSIGALWRPESALGDAATNVMANLVGVDDGLDAYGVEGGAGLVGSQKGGGGTGDHTIGISDLGTIGRAGLHGDRFRRVASLPSDRKKEAKIEPIPGPVRVIGTLDKEIVRRVVRRHLNEVRFCYEKELVHDDQLFGRVVAQFTIAANGAVLAAGVQSSTVHSAAVESCITGAVRRWSFPAPEHGIVQVAYPFVLNRAGD
jgi:hypothetical protein